MGHEEESALCEAVRAAYDRATLEMVLYLKLGKSIDEISREANFEVTVFRVVMAAKRGGWLEAFVAAVVAGQPRNPRMQHWVALYGRTMHGPAQPVRSSAPGLPAWQLMDSAYFDLFEIKRRIRTVMNPAAGQVIGIGVADPEPTFVKKLMDWLRGHAKGASPKDPLYLSPLMRSQAHWLTQLREYREELREVSVLLEVKVDSTLPDDAIARFWSGACHEFRQVNQRLILVFVGIRDSYPDGITVLPAPQFKREDIEDWAEMVLSKRGWPLDLVATWTTWLCARAALDGQPDVLNVRLLYQAMDKSANAFQIASAEQFRAMLENRMIA